MKRAAGYLRCSTDEQGVTSIPQQKAEIERWAATNGYSVTEWFCDEGKSGTDFDKRPAFSELVRRVESAPGFNFVLVYDESRWGRAINPRENSYWKVHFERHGVKVRLVHSSSRNENDIGSYVVEVVESAEASEYSKKLSRAIRRGMLSPQQGRYSRGGTAPYGFKRVAIDLQTGGRRELRDGLRSVPRQEKVVWELGDPMEVETVKRIFKMRIEGYGYVAIADALNKVGVQCPKRGRWRNKDTKWSGITVLGLVKNPAYTGDRVYNRQSFSKFAAQERANEDARNRVNDKSEWVVFHDAHPAIIHREDFEQANSIRDNNPVRPNQHYYRSPYLLTGLVVCKTCSFKFQGFTHKAGYKYYVDGGYINKGKSVCGWLAIRQSTLEAFVIESIRSKFLSSGIEQRVESYLGQLVARQPSEQAVKLDILDRQLSDIEERIKNLFSLAERGVNLDNIAVRIAELESEQRSLRERKVGLEQVRIDPVDLTGIPAMVHKFFRNFGKSFDGRAIDEKKAIIRKVVERLEVDRKEKRVRCYMRRIPNLGLKGVPNQGRGGFMGAVSSLNGNRTRISALRGLRPGPLDDKAGSEF